MSKPMKPIEVAESFLSNVARDLDAVARWLGRAKRLPERDRARRALAEVRVLQAELRRPRRKPPKRVCDCCDRADEYNGFHSGPTIFVCPRHCSCHD